MAISNWLRKGHVGPDRRNDCRTICTADTIIDVLSPQKRHSVHRRPEEIRIGCR